MKNRIFIGCFTIVLLLISSFFIAGDAQGDAILFPWIIKGDSVSTIISVVNEAGDLPGYGGGILPYALHYQYWYKATTANTHAEECYQYDFLQTTSPNDIVTFDASYILNNGDAFYNDPSPTYFNQTSYGYSLSESAPRRAFLIVDNNVPAFVLEESNKDGTLYGEALVIDHITGMFWGYKAYNARAQGQSDSIVGQVYFRDKYDYQGEVIGPEESGKVVILPPDEYFTKFYITPIAETWGQRNGTISAAIELSYKDGEGFEGGIYDNDENPYDSQWRVDVVCTASVSLEELLTVAVYNYFKDSGGQGWAYVKTYDGIQDALTTDQAAIGKLEWTSFTRTFKVDLSDSEECLSCKDLCMKKCEKKPGTPSINKCPLICKNRCRKLCSIEKSLTTNPSLFTWIKSGDSLPPPEYIVLPGPIPVPSNN